jgi:hypothetical protein
MSTVLCAKRARLYSEFEINQIINRINILKKEEEKTSKEIEIAK